MKIMGMTNRFARRTAAALLALGTAVGCSNGVPLGPSSAATTKTTATTTTSPSPPASPTPPGSPTTPPPTPPAPAKVAYTQDLAPIFNSDCVPCHGSRSPAARYNMTSYAGVMAAVAPGSASSALVFVTQPGGLMYSFFGGDRASKSAMVKTWVLAGAPQNR